MKKDYRIVKKLTEGNKSSNHVFCGAGNDYKNCSYFIEKTEICRNLDALDFDKYCKENKNINLNKSESVYIKQI
ncbi:MAG: hypothetical protein PHF86_06285 [Candidatus Nanoarchaeia archaeon]|nr:hypothetical protein [Candidatus Nanoarchaeia archaeon]